MAWFLPALASAATTVGTGATALGSSALSGATGGMLGSVAPGALGTIGNVAGGMLGSRLAGGSGLSPLLQGMQAQMPQNTGQSMVAGLMRPPQHEPPSTGAGAPPTPTKPQYSLLQPLQQQQPFSLITTPVPTSRFSLF